MKKVISIVLILGFLSLVYQFAITFFIAGKESDYTIVSDDINFLVHESFSKKDGDNLYEITIKRSDNDDEYVYSINRNFNHQSVVVRDIKRFDKGNLRCVAPVLKDNSTSEIFCNDGSGIVTYTYLKQNNNNLVDEFVASLKAAGLEHRDWSDQNNFESYEGLQVCKDFPEGYGVTYWSGANLFSFQKDNFKTTYLFNKARTNNKLSLLAGHYYVTVDTDSNTNFDSFHLVNVKDGGKDTIYLEGGSYLSRNIYFAGKKGDSVYVVDRSNRKEYEIHTTQKSVKEIGNDVTGKGKYFNGNELADIDINLLMDREYYFNYNVNVPELQEKYGIIDVRESNDKYYFKTPMNEVYYVLKSDLDHPVKLFRFGNFKEWKVIGDSVFGINGNTVYMYNLDYGLKPILKSGELLSNYYNIYDVFEN